MDNIKEVNGQWHAKVGKSWKMRSNFVFEVLYEVQHPLDSMYVVNVTRQDGVTGVASFRAGDLHNPKVFQGALNRTFPHGNLLCIFKQDQLVPLVSELANQARLLHNTTRKKMVTNAGLQPDGIHIMLNPTQIIDIRNATLVNADVSPYVWLSDVSGCSREELMRNINTPFDIRPLRNFLQVASTIFDNNFGPAILAWCSMYSMNIYRKVLQDVRHFNLPVLYGLPTAGKTLIAQCGAWLNGCSDLHIASRCTLAFVTTWLTSSSLPFVWDDPACSEEVAQLAVDLANGAVRGKSGEDVKTPLTGCLVTANFDLSILYKFFSRLVVFPISTINRQKETGDARLVEDLARMASSAFPDVISALNKIEITDIAAEVKRLELDADIRLLEGIAVPLLCAKVILNMAECYHFMPAVNTYIKDIMVPYYRTALDAASEPQEFPLQAIGDSFIRKILAVIQNNGTNGACCVVKDSVAIRKERLQFLPNKILRREVIEKGGKVNHTVRLMGRPTKCVSLPSSAFGELWELVKAAIGEDSAEDNSADTPQTTEEVTDVQPPPAPEVEETPALQAIQRAAVQPPPAPLVEAPPALQVVQGAAVQPPPAPEVEETPALQAIQRAAVQPPPAPLVEAPPALQVVQGAAVQPPPALEVVAPPQAAMPGPASPHQPAREELPDVAGIPPALHQPGPTAEAEAPEVLVAVGLEPTKPPAPKTDFASLLPKPKRRKADKERIPCKKCGLVGGVALLWVECSHCTSWLHRKCTTVTSSEYKRLQNNPDLEWICADCKK